jgi:hypothetical protein
MHHEQLIALPKKGNRHKIFARIVSRIRRRGGDDGERAGIAGEQSIAVRSCACDLASAERAAGSSAIFHHHRLPQLRDELRSETGDGIGRPARCGRHHNADRSCGIGLRLCGRRIGGDGDQGRSNTSAHRNPRHTRPNGSLSLLRSRWPTFTHLPFIPPTVGFVGLFLVPTA